MKVAFEKIIERLEHIKEEGVLCEGCTYDCAEGGCESRVCDSAIKIVNQVAEEYSHVFTCYLQSPCEYQTKDIIVDVNAGWIPFTDRAADPEEREVYGCDMILSCPLPEEDEEILVTYKNGYVGLDTFLRDGYELYLDSGAAFITEAIAWKPKPAGYCQEGELNQ